MRRTRPCARGFPTDACDAALTGSLEPQVSDRFRGASFRVSLRWHKRSELARAETAGNMRFMRPAAPRRPRCDSAASAASIEPLELLEPLEPLEPPVKAPLFGSPARSAARS